MVFIDFRFDGQENRGIYHSETERILIYPTQHECMEDMLYSITHETIHYALDKAEETLDEDQEEKLIFRIQWANEWL
tara:strand:+ start:868 stop:1098 length:231 start_codon:yes stop_codon:yes gene_type:complete